MIEPAFDISVIICAYTEARWDSLVASIASVQAQTMPAREIIVVIDHNPALLARVREQIPGVTAIENREENGLNGARNSGVAQAQASVVAFLDDDATADPHWLSELMPDYAFANVVGVGGAITPVMASGRPSWFPQEFDWIVGCTYRGMPEETAPIRNLIGANMSFRKEIFQQVGGFRSGMGRIGSNPIACDETELCIRIRQQSPEAVLLHEPRAQVYHHVIPSRATWHYFCARSYSEGLGKATVAHLVGSRDGLSSERAYTFRALPLGVLRGMSDAVLHRDASGLGRAGAIVAGLALAGAGYVRGSIEYARHALKEQFRIRAASRRSTVAPASE
jgi:GT2 family glycosyltransferase